MAFFCCSGGRLRDANAITTALSPDNKIFATMIDRSAAQKVASEKAAKSILSPYVFYVLTTFLNYEQLQKKILLNTIEIAVSFDLSLLQHGFQ
jgi:hypothetical protein